MSIKLDTPPPSPGPTLLINVLEAPEEPSSSLSERSRHQKRKKLRTGSRKRKRIEATSEPVVVDNDASDWTDTAPDAELYIPDSILTHTDETTPTDAGHSRENTNHVYDRYVDAVLADDAPFYQISKEMFIVSRWDVREECNYVRPSSCRSQDSD